MSPAPLLGLVDELAVFVPAAHLLGPGDVHLAFQSRRVAFVGSLDAATVASLHFLLGEGLLEQPLGVLRQIIDARTP